MLKPDYPRMDHRSLVCCCEALYARLSEVAHGNTKLHKIWTDLERENASLKKENSDLVTKFRLQVKNSNRIQKEVEQERWQPRQYGTSGFDGDQYDD